MSTKTARRSTTIAPQEDYNLSFSPPGEVLAAFLRSDDFVRGLQGPYRSAKSSTCCVEVFRRMKEQAPGKDGLRRTRWAVVRQTYPELLTTTLKTFCDWFPPEHFGELKMGYPITYYIDFADVRAEIWFLALDQPADVKKLASMELTGAWANEAREFPKIIIDHLQGRVGQYPAAKDGGCTWAGIIMDTNPPDEDHWWPRMFGDSPPLDDEVYDPFADAEVPIEGIDSVKFTLFKQPSGLSAKAENIEHINGGRLYYVRLATGKDKSFVDVYVHGLYGAVSAGKPVYADFRDFTHVAKEPLVPNPNLPLFLGWDYGLTPSCIIAQITPQGHIRILREIVGKDIDVRKFATMVKRWHLAKDFPGYEIISTGDPAGKVRSQTDKRTCEMILREVGIPTQTASTNNIPLRLDAVNHYLQGMSLGLPKMQIDPSCKTLIYGFKRGYRYKRVMAQGEERFVDVIDKLGNPYTHIQDALQYLCLRVQSYQRGIAVGRQVKKHNYGPYA